MPETPTIGGFEDDLQTAGVIGVGPNSEGGGNLGKAYRRIKSDKQGHFRISLAPGIYWFMAHGRLGGPASLRMVAFIPPQVPTPAVAPPSGCVWIHEIKHDGFRTMLAIDSGKARAFTRNGCDWTERYRRIVKTARGLRCRSAVIQGEIVARCESARQSDL
jgi:ATP dependent DNA ligase domain